MDLTNALYRSLRGNCYSVSLLAALSCGFVHSENANAKASNKQSSTRLEKTGKRAGKPLAFNKSVVMPQQPAPKPGVAKAIAVIDPTTLKLLYGYNAHARRHVASTQKIVTALCVLDAGKLDRQVTVSKADLNTPQIRMNLKAGDKYSRRVLLRALLAASYNDVALALARDTAGSVTKFVARMNARAKRMGMKNTRFANPHGLTAKQYSTAYDMALAASYAYKNPNIRHIISEPVYKLSLYNGKTLKVENTNALLTRYDWVNGMKTGYTNAAGRCLISCGTLNGEAVIVVVLGSTHSKIWGESVKYLKWALKTE